MIFKDSLMYVSRWFMDIGDFTKLVTTRKTDSSYPILRWRRTEPNFIFIVLFMVFVSFFSVDQWYLAWIRDNKIINNEFFHYLTVIGNSRSFFIIFGFLIVLMSIVNLRFYPGQRAMDWHRVYHRLTYLFLAVLISGTIVLLLKNAFGRVRPDFATDSVFFFQPFGGAYHHAAFPSGHATTAGALAMALTLLFPKLRHFWFAVGISVAISRTLVEAHFPSDVIAGFGLGVGVSWYLALYYAHFRILFTFTSRGRPMLRNSWKSSVKGALSSIIKPEKESL